MESLPRPARYFPLEKGVYEVAPGLRTLGTPFGNGEADARVFQLDSEFALYRENKLRCRRERIGKYVLESRFEPRVARAAARKLAETFAREWPAHFRLEQDGGGFALGCALTGETLHFTPDFDLRGASPQPGPPYVSALDALACQAQEDIAVTSVADGRDWLAALHLCAPSHWSGEEKIGRDFRAVHMPVPGIEKVNQASAALVEAMIRKGPYVRFVWGFATDRQLNHHPEPPPGVSVEAWNGRRFKLGETAAGFILRLERQCLLGLPEVDAAIFTIRPSFLDGQEIRANERERALLRSALLSMTPESRRYKGLADSFDDVIRWLDETPQTPGS